MCLPGKQNFNSIFCEYIEYIVCVYINIYNMVLLFFESDLEFISELRY